VNEVNQRLEIGPLPQTAGAHWNGIQSVNSYNFTDSYAQARVVQAPPGGGAEQFLSVGHQQRGADVPATAGQRGSSGDLVHAESRHARTRMAAHPARRRGRAVVFETADDVSGQYSEPWDTVNVPLGTLKFEIKAGADSPPASSVLVAWDDFKASNQ
jgi:hypothetical protein